MSVVVTGPARAAFDRLMARFAVGLRVGGAVAGSVGALLGLAMPASPVVVGVAVAGLLGWAAGYAVLTLRRGWTRWLVAGDVVVVVAICLGYRWLVPAAALPGWSTWVAVVASSAVIVSQLSPLRVLGVVGTVAVPAAYTVGLLLAGQPVRGIAALLVAQGVGTGVLMWMLRRHAAAADVAIAQQEALQRDAAVRESRRAEEREHCRLLHDSVSATLTVVAAAGVAGSPTLRAQARRDLEVVDRILAPAAEPPGLAAVGPTGNGVPGVGRDEVRPADPLPGAASHGGPSEQADRVGLRGWLAPVVAAQPALAVEMAVADLAVPVPVAAAVTDAVTEALRNVVRHAGAARVRLRAWPVDGVVRVELADDGRGFDPAQVPAHRRGLRESVVARMSRVGGSAAITSRPEEGTRVVLQWPAIPADQPILVVQAGGRDGGLANGAAGARGGDGGLTADAAGAGGSGGNGSGTVGAGAAGSGGLGELVAARYQRGFELAVVGTLGVRHVANALVPIVAHRSSYRSVGVELVTWAVLAGVGVVGSIRLLRRRTGPVGSWLLAAVALAASAVATAAVASGQELTPAHWALGATGWFGMIVLLRRPIAELATLIVINAGFTLVVLLHDGVADRVSLARFLLMVYVMAALQLGLALVVGALDRTGRRAAAAAERQATISRRVQVAEALHRGRLDRYETVRRSVVPLLVGLANGELDPADRRTQRRCAVEESRLRRLFAETDDVADPLLHELRACADIAYRRGIPVDLQVVGQLPVLSRPVRRALTEAPLHALAGSRRQARVTVFGRSDEVTVSVLADAQLGEPAELPTPLDRALTVTVLESMIEQEGENRRWIEARWRG
jgi:signal transduction histidine kinase